MASSKPKKGFSMSLSKTKGPSSASKGRSDGERAPIKSSAIGVGHQEGEAGQPKRDYVTGIGGGKVVTKEPVIERGPRVIALASNPWARSAASVTATAGTEPSANNASSTPTPSAVAGTANGGSTTAAVAASPPAGSSAAAGEAAVGADKEPEKSLDQLAAEALARESRSAGSGGRPSDRDGLGLDSDRVISMAARPGGNAATAPGVAAGGGSGAAGRGRKGGLLEQNMIPGLADVEGEDAKFKHDLGHRAEDMNVRSMAYVDVPVSEFGAALLRGMGWQGPDGDGASGSGEAGANLLKDVEPRHHRLGLGAQPKPPEEMKRPRKRKPGEKPRASDAERLKIWEQKVREEKAQEASRPRAGQLSVMDVVEIMEGGDGSSRQVNGGTRRPRAMVLKTQGVPGLNKISVRMEDTGEKVLVDKSSATRVSEDELARRPFSSDKRAKTNADTEGRDDSARSYRGSEGGGGGRNGGDKRSRSRSRSVDRNSRAEEEKEEDRRGAKKQKRSKKEKKKERKGGGSVTTTTTTTGSSSSSKRERSGRSSPPPGSDEDRNAERRRRNPDDRSNSDRGRNGGDRDDGASWSRKRPRETTGTENGVSKKLSNSGGEKRSSEPTWLRGNIRVRVVHKSYAEGRAYLGKGIVVDVPRVGEATVRMDQGDRVLEGVKQRHLETVLPTRGGKVIVVQGREKGTTGKLLAKDKDKATALVQVYEDLRALTLSLDDVAEFTGMLDEDMEGDGY